jgi:hypothetical protein
VGLGFELRDLLLKRGVLPLEPHLLSIFLWLFGDEVLQTICLAWTQTSVLPMSASQVARITVVSNWYPAAAVLINITPFPPHS